jgi:hypothetical protein
LPHSRGPFDDRVAQGHQTFRAPPSQVGNQFKVVSQLDEAQADRFVKPETRHRSAQRALASFAHMIFARQAAPGKFSLDLVKAGMPRDFFDQVFFDGDVVAP